LKSDKIVLPIYLVVAVEEVKAPVEAASNRSTDARAQDVGDSTVGDASSANLDLLLDIELQASLRFGGREMLLSEILDMAPGDVVPLDRSVHAPVDLVIGDRIVARGEVVLVDGNYGLRVTEVAEPRKRLETVRCLF
jgi:flagellar motor switch protein FliN